MRELVQCVQRKRPTTLLYAGLIIMGMLFLMMIVSLFGHRKILMRRQVIIRPNFATLSEHLWYRSPWQRCLIARHDCFADRLLVGLTTLLISGTIGIGLGLRAGFKGGWADIVIMRLIEVFATIPGTILLLLFITVFGRGTVQTIIAISLMSFTTFTRMVRSKVSSLRQQEHILWASYWCERS